MNRTAPLPLLPLAASIALAACGGGGGTINATTGGGGAYGGGGNPPPPPAATEKLAWPSPSFASVQAIFTARCTTCHGTNGGLSLAAPGSWSNLVGVAAQASLGTRVVAHDSAGSVLYQRLTGAGGLASMPLGGPALAASDLATVRAWIDEGGARQDLNLSLTGMTPHVGQRVLLRLESDSGELRTKIVLDPLPGAAFDVSLPRVRPSGAHVLAMWADENGNGTYDAPPTDHAWRIPVPESGVVAFAHSTTFTDVGAAAASEPGLDFTLQATGMTPHLGQTFVVAVFKRSAAPADDALVGVYRLDAVPAASFSIRIPGIIAAGENYWVDLHADLNGNGRYDAPPADHAWRIVQSSTASGLSVAFAHDTAFTDVSLPPP